MIDRIIAQLEVDIDVALAKLEEHMAYEYDNETGQLSKRGNNINAIYKDIINARECFRRKHFVVGEDELNMVFSIDKD